MERIFIKKYLTKELPLFTIYAKYRRSLFNKSSIHWHKLSLIAF